jgi:hypothetical protein
MRVEKGTKAVKSFPGVNEKKARKWLWVGLAALAAVQLYFVQEMMAALVLFSILFAVVATGVLLVYLFDRAGQRAMDWAEPRAVRAARSAHRAWDRVEEVSKKQLHRLRSETAR